MQILHPFTGTIQQYLAESAEVDRYRPHRCPQCKARRPLSGHGFYRRSLAEAGFDGMIRVRRYVCRLCRRTVSLLPEFALPWLRFSLSVIALFLVARLGRGLPLAAAAQAAGPMPYQRGQFWIRRFRRQAPALGLALRPLAAPPPAPDFVGRALAMLEAIGWIPAHRFLFGHLDEPLLGWPRSRAGPGPSPALAAGDPAG